jgi:hypothetical protein
LAGTDFAADTAAVLKGGSALLLLLLYAATALDNQQPAE